MVTNSITSLSNVFTDDILKNIKEKPSISWDDFSKKKIVLFVTTDGENEYSSNLSNMIFDIAIYNLLNNGYSYDYKITLSRGRLVIEDNVLKVVEDNSLKQEIGTTPISEIQR